MPRFPDSIRLLIILIAACVSNAHAQVKYDENWILGLRFSDNRAPDRLQIHFDQKQANMEIVESETNFNESATCMSNAEGELIFYSEGCHIYNRRHEIMLGGERINDGETFDLTCTGSFVDYPTYRSSMMIMPFGDSIYHIYHLPLESRINSNIIWSYAPHLYRTIIDMSGDNGYGEVIEKNEIIIEKDFEMASMCMMYNSEDETYWLLVPDFYGLGLDVLKCSKEGILDHTFQNVRQSDGPFFFASSNFSPDGTKVAFYSSYYDLFLFDFDVEEGVLSNKQTIVIEDEETIFAGGVAFSPNSQFVYTSSATFINQYDVTAEDVQESEVRVADYDGFEDLTGSRSYFGDIQLAPDCKMYLNTAIPTHYLHIIENPNAKGLDCNVEQHAIQMPLINDTSLPYFTSFREWDDYCDRILSTESIDNRKYVLNVRPNPAIDYLNIDLDEVSGKISRVLVLDIYGRTIKDLNIDLDTKRLDISDLKPGYYYFYLNADSDLYSGGFVKL